MATILKKSIFYHIPKTGGTWVDKAIYLSMGDGDDLIYRKPEGYLRGVGDAFEWRCSVIALWGGLTARAHQVPSVVADKDKKGLFSFAFVREPLSWYKSWWLSRKAARDSGNPWRTFLLDFILDDDFNKFIADALRMFPEGALTTLYRCFLGKNGDELDFVGRQENLREDLCEALTLAGEDFEREPIMKLQRFNTRAFSDQELQEKDVSEENFSILHDNIKLDGGLEKELKERERWVTDTFYKK